MRYFPAVNDVDRTRMWIERTLVEYAEYACGLWAVEWKDSGIFVGVVGLKPRDLNAAAEIEIGYMILPQFLRQGIALEAAHASKEYGLSTLGLTRLIALINPDNEPSIGVALKLGLALETQAMVHDQLLNVYSLSTEQG